MSVNEEKVSTCVQDIKHLEVLVAERDRLYMEKFTAAEKALVLEAKELARRLDELNHAHARAVEQAATFTPREIFEGSLRESRAWQENVSRELSELRGGRSGIAIAASVVMSVVAMALVVAQYLKGLN